MKKNSKDQPPKDNNSSSESSDDEGSSNVVQVPCHIPIDVRKRKTVFDNTDPGEGPSGIKIKRTTTSSDGSTKMVVDVSNEEEKKTEWSIVKYVQPTPSCDSSESNNTQFDEFCYINEEDFIDEIDFECRRRPLDDFDYYGPSHMRRSMIGDIIQIFTKLDSYQLETYANAPFESLPEPLRVKALAYAMSYFYNKSRPQRFFPPELSNVEIKTISKHVSDRFIMSRLAPDRSQAYQRMIRYCRALVDLIVDMIFRRS